MEDQPTRHVCGLVTYDGADYNGFQSQVGVPTIQDALEEALAACAQIDGRVIGSGRTDAGVHAAGQVIGVHVRWRHGVDALQRAWNAHLPASIVVHKLQTAPQGFHPRFSATARTYRYTLCDATTTPGFARVDRAPLTDRFALFVPRRLDVAAMQTACGHLIGQHDFAAFGQPPQGENTVRRIMAADVDVVNSSLPPLTESGKRQIVFTIRADAFLRQMVRNIVGTLVDVGLGRRSSQDVHAVLLSRDRGQCSSPAPPQGLVLERVDYPTEFALDL